MDDTDPPGFLISTPYDDYFRKRIAPTEEEDEVSEWEEVIDLAEGLHYFAWLPEELAKAGYGSETKSGDFRRMDLPRGVIPPKEPHVHLAPRPMVSPERSHRRYR